MSYADQIRTEASAYIMRELIADGIEENKSIADTANSNSTNALSTASNANNRVDAIITGTGASDSAEVADSHHDNITNTNYTSLGKRLDTHSERLEDIAINVKRFGAKGDGTTDDTEAINSAIEYAKTISIHYAVGTGNIQEDQSKPQLRFPAGKYIYNNSTNPINWDVYKFSIYGEGAIIKFTSTDSTKFAIQMSSSDPWTSNPYHQETVYVKGLTLYGSGSKGIQCYSDDAGTSRIFFERIKMQGFANGTDIVFSNNSYLQTFLHCIFDDGIDNQGGTNEGENIRFIACLFGGDPCIHMNEATGDMYLLLCSFDYCGQFIKVDHGQVTCRDCHFENNANGVYSSSKRPFYIGASYDAILLVEGGNLGFINYNNTTIDYIIENHNAGVDNGATTYKGGAYFKNLQIVQCATTTNQFSTGEGNTVLTGIFAKAYENNFVVVDDKAVNNLLLDGNFDQTSLIDLWSTTGVQNNAAIALTTEDKFIGNQSLKITKAFGAGSEANVILKSPINNIGNKIIGVSMMIKNNGFTSNANVGMNIFLSYACLDGSGNILKNQQTNDTIDGTSQSQINWDTFGTGWKPVSFEPVFRSRFPKWANSIIITFRLFSTNGTSVNAGSCCYIDNIVINAF